jgi:hypothetical protein
MNADLQKEAPQFRERTLSRVCLLAGSIASAGVALQIILLMPTLGQTTTWESAALTIAWQVRSGLSAYLPIEDNLLYVSLYGPAYTYSLGWVGRLLDLDRLGMIGMARGYSALAFAGALLLLVVLSRPAGGNRWAPWVILLPVGAFPLTMTCFVASSRPDAPALLWSVVALALALRRRWPWLALAAISAGLATLHKQTALAAPLAVFIWLLLTDHRLRAATFLFVWLGLVTGVAFAMNLATDGQLIAHQKLVAAVPMCLGFGWFVLTNEWLWLALVVLLVAGFAASVGAWRARGIDQRRLLALLYALVSLPMALWTVCRGGSGANYFIEFFLAVGWFAALALGDRAKGSLGTLSRSQLVVAIALLANPLLWFLPARVKSAGELRKFQDDAMSPYQDRLTWLREQPRPLLCLDAWLAYCAGVDGHLGDPTIYAFLSHADPEWDPLTPRVAGREFASVVTFRPTNVVKRQSYQGVPNVPLPLLEALWAQYLPGEKFPPWYSYCPRPPDEPETP